jgi:hypothetical protein
MPLGHWTPDDLVVLREEVEAGGTWQEIAERVHSRLPHQSRIPQTIMSKARRVGYKRAKVGFRPKPEQQAESELDLARGEGIVRFYAPKGADTATYIRRAEEGLPRGWEVYHVSAWPQQSKNDGVLMLHAAKVRRKPDAPRWDALERLVSRLIDSGAGPRIRRPRTPSSGCLLVLGLYDHHFGCYAWGRETGADYDLQTAHRLYLEAVTELLEKAKPHGVARICLPVGQDFFHLNDPSNATPQNRNALDVDSRYAKVMEVGEAAFVCAVELCAAVAPVVVPWVPGNHDPEASYALARITRAWFRQTKHVEVDAEPAIRKRIRHGINLIGIAHGDQPKQTAKWPLLMAQEWPKDWAATQYREWLLGHLHTRGETHFLPLESHGGVIVRRLPNLSAPDAWHYSMGYIGNRRAADGYLYHEADGYVGSVVANVREP